MSTRPIHTTPHLRGIGYLAGLFLLGAATLSAASFDEQRAAGAASVETQSEDAITNLLKAGIAGNRPAPAVALANELSTAFTKAGWRVRPVRRTSLAFRPGLYVFAAEEQPPEYVKTASAALAEAGFEPAFRTGYNPNYE